MCQHERVPPLPHASGQHDLPAPVERDSSTLTPFWDDPNEVGQFRDVYSPHRAPESTFWEQRD